ncbi:MAG TPA: hypothetical protein VGK73_35170 [Polyangiaceae bacterium]
MTDCERRREYPRIPTPPPRPTEHRALLAGILIVYASLVAWLAYHHEPWRDEADAWLMARDASLGELLHIMGAAGTPSLWYFLQIPFAKLGAPFAVQAALNWLVSVVAAGLFLFHARLPLAIRVLFLFGYFMAFEYSVVARSYALSLALLFAAAALYRNRERHPVLFGAAVGLAANTNVHSFFIANALAALLLWECLRARFRAPQRTALLVASAGILAAFLQLLPPKDGQMTSFFASFGPGNLVRGVKLAFVPTQYGTWAFVLGLAALASSLLTLLARPKALLFAALAYTAFGYLFVFKYVSFTRHFGFILVILLLALWLAEEEPENDWVARLVPSPERRVQLQRAAFALLGTSLALSVYFAAVTWRADLTKHFSDAPDMAAYLKQNGLDRRRIASNPAGWGTSILAYFPNLAFYYPALGETRTHMKWDKSYNDAALVPHAEAIRLLKARFPDWSDPERGILLVLANGALEHPEQYGYRLRYATPGNLFEHLDERFYLYEPESR